MSGTARPIQVMRLSKISFCSQILRGIKIDTEKSRSSSGIFQEYAFPSKCRFPTLTRRSPAWTEASRHRSAWGREVGGRSVR